MADLTASAKTEPSAPFSSSAPDSSSLTGATMNDSSGAGNGCGLGFDADSIMWEWAASGLDISALNIVFDWSWDIDQAGAQCDTSANHTRMHFEYSVNSGSSFSAIQSVQITDGSGSVNFLIPGGVVDPSVVRVRVMCVAYANNCFASPACVTTGVISNLKIVATENQPQNASQIMAIM